MQIVAEPRQEAKDIAKMIMCADDQSIMWFSMGCWYVDCLWAAIFTLPEDDPALAQMLNGQLGSREAIAQNILRIEMAREETTEFMRNLRAPIATLVRASLHRPHAARLSSGATQARLDEVAAKFCLMALKIAAEIFRLLPSIGWMILKRRFKILTERSKT